MTDLALIYSGGSGGFFALHQILLMNRYSCLFKNNKTFADIFEHQWDIPRPTAWKMSETWPDNDATNLSNIEHKLFFYCNQSDLPLIIATAIKVLIYTDINTQVLLARNKRANWFNWQGTLEERLRSFKQQLSNSIIESYNTIKGDTWPLIDSAEQLKLLPQSIQNELAETNVDTLIASITVIDSLVASNTLNTTTDFSEFDYGQNVEVLRVFRNAQLDLSTVDYLGERVTGSMSALFNDPTVIKIKFQDIIKTRGEILSIIGCATNAASRNFIDRYLQLHNNEMLGAIT